MSTISSDFLKCIHIDVGQACKQKTLNIQSHYEVCNTCILDLTPTSPRLQKGYSI